MDIIGYILEQFAQPMNIALLVGANIVGLIFGAIPGLSGTMAVMLFMPLTFAMDDGTENLFQNNLTVVG